MKGFLKKILGQKIVAAYHYALACAGAVLYGFPSKKLFVIGVTGTKGKSTVLELIDALLTAGGKKTALLSSVRKKIGIHEIKNRSGNTMPGRCALQRFFRDAVRSGCDTALVEVTSQGVVQHRQKFIDWDAAVITNLEPEHIESHGSFENYRNAKVAFFRTVATSKKDRALFFINKTLKEQDYFLEAIQGYGSIIFFSPDDVRAQLLSRWLAPDFNMENAAAAVAVAKKLGVSENIIKEVLKTFSGVPGRLEIVQERPFRVVIDYAHTPDSLERLYEFLKKSGGKKRGRLICVLGAAAGGRDRWKRPIMGNIAAQHCAEIILTNEDPYDEEPSHILREIRSGMEAYNASHIYEILDRKAAIKRAVFVAEVGDTVVITGKGSETSMHMARGEQIPWNERQAVLEALQ